MKRLVVLALLFLVATVPVFAEVAATPVQSEERTCENSSCTCNPCNCSPCECQSEKDITCCGQENCQHGDNDDTKTNNGNLQAAL